MDNYPGKLIVIDGTDGSGKTTQLKLLKERLKNEGYSVKEADFPQYNTKSAGLVEEYLSGKYGQANDVTPYQSSIFYAVDRFDASFKIKEWLKEGKIVLSNRYVSSSLGHQGGKIDNPLERKDFFNWLYDLEYKIFNLPKPNLSLILYVDPEISQRLSVERKREDWKGKTKDIHEDNLEHLRKAAKIFMEISQSFSGFKLIHCTKDEQILPRPDINNLIYSQVEKLLKNQNLKKEDKKNSWQSIGDILVKNGKLNNINITTNTNYATIKKEKEKKEDTLKIERLSPQAKLPQKAHPSDAGFDLFASEDYSIPAYGQALIKTGLKLAIPENCVGLIWDKSGLANLGYTTMGGVIDSNYRGEVKVVFKNLSEDIVNIEVGQKIAQLLIQKIENLKIKETNIKDKTSRQEGGFGSTGQF
jgi:dTMP kinase